jgi:plastocyanin
MFKLSVMAAIVVAASGLLACGSDSKIIDHPDWAASDTVETPNAGTYNYVFFPGSVYLSQNGTVTFINGSDANHNVYFDDVNGAPTDITSLPKLVGMDSRTFPSKGIFDYTCKLHFSMGGNVLVETEL